ncbi:hypothetical protein MTO96_031685 [Rhipicephalus appendiculatus]
MASPPVLSPPGVIHVSPPLGTRQAEASSITTNELELSKGESQQHQFVCIIGCILGTLAFLIALISVVVLISPSVADDEARTTAAAVPESSSGGGTPMEVNTVIVPRETVRPHVPTTTERPTTKPGMTTSTVVLTRAFPWSSHGPFLCTVSIHFAVSSKLPQDRLCDVIFYDSFYVKNYPSGWNDSGLDHFFELMRNMRWTEMGASFSIVSGQLFEDAYEGGLYSSIDFLDNKKSLRNFGILHIYGSYVTDGQKFAKCVTILKDLASFLKHKHRWHYLEPFGYLVLGLEYPGDYRYLNEEQFKRVSLVLTFVRGVWRSRNFHSPFPVSFIVITHLMSPYMAGDQCTVYPMSMTSVSKDMSRRNVSLGLLSIDQALKNLEWIRRIYKGQMLMYISFSMRALYYTLYEPSDATVKGAPRADAEAYFDLFGPCNDSSYGKHQGDLYPKQACKKQYGKYYRYNAEVGAEYSFDPNENRTFVFDSEKGIKEKVCAALINRGSLVFNLAAYDIDFDQDEAPCPNLFIGRGPFRRVQALRFLNDYTPVLADDLNYKLQHCMAGGVQSSAQSLLPSLVKQATPSDSGQIK